MTQWQWASQMTDWCSGSWQVKWLTDVVTWWCVVAVGKSNDWLMCDTVMYWCCDVVEVGKSNDWLTWWYSGSGQVKWRIQWCSCSGEVKWLTDMVMWWCGNAMMWWQWASQMTDWGGDAVATGKSKLEFQAYFEVLHPLWVADGLKTLKCITVSPWLPLVATNNHWFNGW